MDTVNSNTRPVRTCDNMIIFADNGGVNGVLRLISDMTWKEVIDKFEGIGDVKSSADKKGLYFVDVDPRISFNDVVTWLVSEGWGVRK